MNKTETRRALRACHYDVYLSRASPSGYFEATIRVEQDEGVFKGDVYVRVEAQANDVWRRPGEAGKEGEYERGVKRLPGLSYFYGATIASKHALSFGVSPYENPRRAEAFFGLVRETIERFNLQHKHPSCEVSQIAAALDLLGCRGGEWVFTGSGGGSVPLRQWMTERERERPAEPGETQRTGLDESGNERRSVVVACSWGG